jgi:hypothetical protein
MHLRGGNRRRSERGQTMALVAVSIVSLLAMAALAIDVVTLYVAHGQAERAADAAALAAAKVLADSGVTTDPSNGSSPSFWNTACTAAVGEATAVANQNLIAGQTPSTVNVTFPAFAGSTCTGSSPPVFGIDPQVTVQVTVTSVPTFFARIWSKASSSVSASATAEAFNPSDSTSLAGNTVPIIPLGIKPILLPNCDPSSAHTGHQSSACLAALDTFIDPSIGTITNPGAYSSGGVIGETFTLQANCTAGAPAKCTPGSPGLVGTPTPTSLGYYPLTLPTTAGYLCSGTCGTGLPTGFEQDLGCVNLYPLACGQTAQLDNSDANPNGSSGLAQTAGQCLIHETTQSYTQNCGATLDQDCLDASTGPPYTMKAGASNPLIGVQIQPSGIVSVNDPISISDSVVNLPIYQPAGAPSAGATVTIIGYLQAFLDDVDPNGVITVHVLNVAGCGSSATTSPASKVAGAGTAIPVRLIHN